MGHMSTWNSKTQWKRRQLMQYLMIIMDEGMPGWRLKTYKLGQKTNYTHEPSKPVSVGTTLNNSAKCKSGIIDYDDFVQNPETQHRKKYSKEKSKLPDGSKLLVHTVEVLRQVKCVRMVFDDWVDGDAFFSNVSSYAELNFFNENSTFMVKNSTIFFNDCIE